MAVADEGHSIGLSLSSAGSTVYEDHGNSSVDQQRKGLAVSFKEEPPEVHEVPVDKTEIQERWYSKGEYFFIKKEALNLVRRMSSSNVKDTDSISTRGLEVVDDRRVRKRKEAIDKVVKCILETQQMNGSDPECLAPVYKNMAQPCVRQSIDNASCDAKDAELYLADARRQWNFAARLKQKRFRLFHSLYQKLYFKKSS